MILRLAFVLVVLSFQKTSASDGPVDCKTRVDILDGSQLSPGLAALFTETKAANTAKECALACYRRKCDVAYFHSPQRICQFTADSANGSPLNCARFMAIPTATMNGDADKVSRFCIRCGGWYLQKFYRNEMITLICAISNSVSKTPPRVLKRVVIPVKPTGRTQMHRSMSGSWRTTERRSRIPMRPTTTHNLNTRRGLARNKPQTLPIRSDPVHLNFNATRHSKSSRKFMSKQLRQKSRVNRLKHRSIGIARKRREAPNE